MNVLDLFSGIGGFSLGLERAGFETVAFCEFDEKCQKVLAKHWPDVPQYGDVRELTAERLKNDGITDIGLICGGYPCQPFSLAGKRDGEEDDRHLWPEIARLLEEFADDERPIEWCIFENVYGHITMGLDSVLADLEALNYTCWPSVVPACAVGAYHQRNRVWIVAHSNSKHRGADQREPDTAPNGRHESGGGREDVADSQSQRIQRNGTATQQEPHSQAEKRLLGRDSARSYPGNWLPEPAVGRLANGIPNRAHRLKQLGNAVVPQIPEMIGRAIMATNKQQDKP